MRAANSLQIAYAIYNRRLGEPLQRVPDLDDHITVDEDLVGAPVEELVRRATESRSEVAALSERSDSLASQAAAEAGKSRPQLALTGGYIRFDNAFLDRQDFSMVGIGITWNLFDGGQARNRAAALNSASRAAADRLEDLRAAIELEVRQSWLDTRAAHARVRASREAVAQAGENLRMSRELYGAGLVANTQVLDAVALQVDAVNNRDNAMLDASLAALRLKRAVGSL